MQIVCTTPLSSIGAEMDLTGHTAETRMDRGLRRDDGPGGGLRAARKQRRFHQSMTRKNVSRPIERAGRISAFERNRGYPV